MHPKYFDPFEAGRQRHLRDVQGRQRHRQQLLNLHRHNVLYNLRHPMEGRRIRATPDGRELWYAGLTDQHANSIYLAQPPNSNWCWAACFSMLFRHFGLQLSPAAIVQIVLGEVSDRTIQPEMLEHHMRRIWVDDQWIEFQARLEIIRKVVDLTPQLGVTILENMKANRMHFIAEGWTHIALLRGLEVVLDPRSGNLEVIALHILDPGRSADVRVDISLQNTIPYIAGVEILRR